MSLTAPTAGSRSTLRRRGQGSRSAPSDPGRARLTGATLQGSNLTLSRFVIDGEVTVEPGSTGMDVDHNRISGGYFGVNAGPTSSTPVNDVAITGNKFVGPFGEDAIRLNRYHDTGDPDPYGILIQGNEITNVRENGNHSDCLQTAWVGDHLYFRRNYLHDNRCQGFFVSDQATPIKGIFVDDNLFLRDAAPCDPPARAAARPRRLRCSARSTGSRSRATRSGPRETAHRSPCGTGRSAR